MRIILTTLLVVFSLAVSAAPKKKKGGDKLPPLPEKKVSLRETALEESQYLAQAGITLPNQASDAQVTQHEAGMLKLQDTYRPKYQRTWVWNFGLTAESYQPQGQGEIQSVSTYSYSEAGKTVMPSISLGILSQDYALLDSPLQVGMDINLGYANQRMNLVTPTNTIIEAQLQTFRGSLSPLLRYQWISIRHLHTLIKAHYGQTQLYQTSQNSLARQSKTTNFIGYSLGFEYEFSRSWGLNLNYTDRRGLSQEVVVTGSNLDMGASLRW